MRRTDLIKGAFIILFTVILMGSLVHLRDKVSLQRLLDYKMANFMFKEDERIRSQEPPKQVIIWSRVRSGSSFLGGLLQRWDYFYSFEPIATYWPSYWEVSNSTSNSTGVNASIAVQFLRDILPCNFEKHPQYVRMFLIKHRYVYNPLTLVLCGSHDPRTICSNLEILKSLCKAADVHVLKVVRLHLRHAFELLQEKSMNIRNTAEQKIHRSVIHNDQSTAGETSVKHLKLERSLENSKVNLTTFTSFYNNKIEKSNLLSDHRNEVLPNIKTTQILPEHQIRVSNTNKSVNKINNGPQISNGHYTQEELPTSKENREDPLAKETELDLKLIHLVRDPRGVMDSRIRNPWVKGHRKKSQTLCDELNDELKYAKELKRRFPTRYRLIRYEWLVLDVETASHDLYEWLNLPYTIHEANFIATHSKGLKVDHSITMPFSTFRNSSSNAFRWRENLDFEEMLKIQTACKDVIQALGYRFYYNLEDYRNSQLTPMLAKTDLD